ncbi:Gfo/Idh/MocA family protein [Kribbella sindirgiensis]|uniref:Gfo/Idh/MocA family oxidoreductase n=1 Tax=Kribbella sindirgiensis TaxID=1124744 RepID=A0A4R0IMJ1_9ACTN|nr:Gfo/Idh/MocA family oxidoreductase [Kribbella sindirgiensis]TCC34823.1 Gfo/Idh/MocA family oxidoreductase [Kribbella sindirgiensis]
MNDQKLRVGVVGLGFAGRTALEAFSELPDVEVIGLAGLEKDILTSLGEKHGVPHLYERWEDLLETPGLEAVSIGTPTQLHAPIALAALQKGLHVLSEKPLARTVAEGTAMVEASKQAGRVLKVVFNHRERGDVAALKHQIDEGQLGRIYYAKAHWMRRNGIPGMGGWFTNRELSGGGPLIDLGVHILDMALHLMGEPQVSTVSASTFAELGPRGKGSRDPNANTLGSAFEVEDLATAYLRLQGGGALQLETSWATYRAPGDNFGIELFGTDGGAKIEVQNYTNEDTLRIFTDVGGVPAEVKPATGAGLGHRAVVAEFVRIVKSGEWEGQNGSEALLRTEIIDACYASAKAGREVVLHD